MMQKHFKIKTFPNGYMAYGQTGMKKFKIRVWRVQSGNMLGKFGENFDSKLASQASEMLVN